MNSMRVRRRKPDPPAWTDEDVVALNDPRDSLRIVCGNQPFRTSGGNSRGAGASEPAGPIYSLRRSCRDGDIAYISPATSFTPMMASSDAGNDHRPFVDASEECAVVDDIPNAIVD